MSSNMNPGNTITIENKDFGKKIYNNIYIGSFKPTTQDNPFSFVCECTVRKNNV